MNSYLCLKPCEFAGTRYVPGDIVPQANVLPGRVRTLINQGYIAQTNGPAPIPGLIFLTVPSGDDTVEIGTTPDGVVAALKILSVNSETAQSIIRDETAASPLELAALFEQRTAVKTAALNKAGDIRAGEADVHV
jgi:hypothetical protein